MTIGCFEISGVDDMNALRDAYGLFRFTLDLKGFLRKPITIEEAESTVRQAMENRGAAFMDLIKHRIFENNRSPYLCLFRNAGCELGDVANLVQRNGVEETLLELLDSGIFVSFEEFKGQAPAVRGRESYSFKSSDFDNPSIKNHFRSTTGGTRGRPTPVKMDLDHIGQTAPHWALLFAAHNLQDSALIYWTQIYAAVANGQLRCAKFGNPMTRWFSMGTGGTRRDKLIAQLVHGLIRQAAGFPKPEYTPLSDAEKVGEYLAAQLREGIRPCLHTSPSAACRIALAMTERGVSLSGAAFLLRGEPLTAARRATIESSHATAIQTYGFVEGGVVGAQCPNPDGVDDIHIFSDAFALIPRSRIRDDGTKMQTLLLTGLRRSCPKIMLNVQIGDYGLISERTCACSLHRVGYVKHVRSIRSFEKLTGEGVTFEGADIYRLIEEVLPEKFGGDLTDYQLLEEQDDHGLPRYSLLVSPRIGQVREAVLRKTFLDELAKIKEPYRMMTNLWAQANILHVKRRSPHMTSRGKIMPFRTLGPSDEV
jgi:hypothetical protein